ncbi:helix-turn-helix domain-containing protein [Erysipelotrichaceae bacterium 66-17]|nr:AraC family transcriptional regulator [Erysipelotrichaceae bacterium]
MQNLTTNFRFKKYGDVFYQMPEAGQYLSASAITLKMKTFNRVFYSSSDIYITNEEGISILFVSLDMVHFDQFIVHRVVKINPDVYFNIVPVSDPSDIIMYYQESDLKQMPLPEPMEFRPIVPHLEVQEILQAVFYVRKGNYHGRGHIDNFYKMIYVDQGTMQAIVDDHEYTLNQYDALIIDPGQKHVVYTSPECSCSYLAIDFNMKNTFKSITMPHYFHTDKHIHQILSHFMNALEINTIFNDELAIVFLKEALLMLYQNGKSGRVDPMQEHFESTLLNEIIVYIHNNLFSPISVEDLCVHFSISRSTIQNLFRSQLDMTPKQYISELKLSEAQKLILQHKYTISEISNQLGFTSIHYFSRKFKERFDMSPTEFAKKGTE